MLLLDRKCVTLELLQEKTFYAGLLVFMYGNPVFCRFLSP